MTSLSWSFLVCWLSIIHWRISFLSAYFLADSFLSSFMSLDNRSTNRNYSNSLSSAFYGLAIDPNGELVMSWFSVYYLATYPCLSNDFTAKSCLDCMFLSCSLAKSELFFGRFMEATRFLSSLLCLTFAAELSRFELKFCFVVIFFYLIYSSYWRKSKLLPYSSLASSLFSALIGEF